MFGHSGFSHMSGILWECGKAERSETSTALNARTRVRAKEIWQLALPEPVRSALHTPYGHSFRFTSIFLFFDPFLFMIIIE